MLQGDVDCWRGLLVLLARCASTAATARDLSRWQCTHNRDWPCADTTQPRGADHSPWGIHRLVLGSSSETVPRKSFQPHSADSGKSQGPVHLKGYTGRGLSVHTPLSPRARKMAPGGYNVQASATVANPWTITSPLPLTSVNSAELTPDNSAPQKLYQNW